MRVHEGETVAALKPRMLGFSAVKDEWRVVHAGCYLDEERQLGEYPEVCEGSTLELRGKSARPVGGLKGLRFRLRADV